ncbi:MAG: hypothetical protein RL263_174 [Bacteroidota bacterium]|jgi:4-hydroxybenzoate polyprenyltransferase
MIHYLRIIRPINILLTILTQWLFYLSASRINPGLSFIDFSNLRFPESITATLACVLVAAGGYVINDIFDVETDKINRPGKRIAVESTSVKSMKMYYLILTFTGISLGFITGLGMGILSTVIAILLYFYSSDFKSEFLMGNLLISLMAGMVVYIASRGVFLVNKAYFAEFSSIAFFITFARELIKDLEDYAGDKEHGYETFAISSGPTKTKILASIFIVFSLALLFLVGATGNQLEYWIFLFAVLTPLHLYLLYKIYAALEKPHYSHISNWLKYLMFIGLLASLIS